MEGMKHYDAKEKARILEEQEGSGLSLWGYCQKAGMNYQTVARWQREAKGKRSSRLDLAEVELCDGDEVAEGIEGGVRIQMSGGVELILGRSTDIKWIAKLCRELSQC